MRNGLKTKTQVVRISELLPYCIDIVTTMAALFSKDKHLLILVALRVSSIAKTKLVESFGFDELLSAEIQEGILEQRELLRGFALLSND